MPLILALLASMHGAVAAQEQFPSSSGDPRFQTILYAPDHVATLQGVPGYQITIELSPDEQVQNIALGDSGSWSAAANRKGDHLFIKPLQPDASTNMTVITNVRTYYFELLSGGSAGPETAYKVRFRYPAEQAKVEQSAEGEGFLAPNASGPYRISGNKLIRPSKVTTDGRRTYLSWPADRALPAVFLLGEDGRETVADGMMRGDLMVIDRVAPRLIFRIDGRTARAERIVRRRGR